MEAIPDLVIRQRMPRPNNARRTQSARRRTQSARMWLDESPQTTARTIESSEPGTARSLQDFFDDEHNDYDEDEEWATKVNEATNVKDAMKELFKSDPEIFYLYGQDVLKMLEYRFQHKLDDDN